ncbi:hypothetical protein [Cellulosimicrobium marinum]|uniref:hypothetical protein n=1 Tax=Cellulosimicrobium marinum TaxID=1638992 RepID=UPI001E4EFB67|nr:hypothetical protein [Cellulosimicrobium marinum]
MGPGRRASHVLVTAALLVTWGLAGCITPSPAGDDAGEPTSLVGAGEETAGGAERQDASPGGGTGEGTGGVGVVPSPVRVPAFSQIGQGIDEAFPAIEDAVAAACGGELCLVLVREVIEGDESSELCAFSGLRPASGAVVERDEVLVVEVRCPPEGVTEPRPEPGVGPQDPDGDESDGGNGTVPDDGASPGDDSDG